MKTTLSISLLFAILAPVTATATASDAPVWTPDQQAEIHDRTLTVRLAPTLDELSTGERAALDELLAAGEIFQQLYESSQHPEALAARRDLEAMGESGAGLSKLYRLFKGPIATTIDNRREPFLAVEPPQPGRNFYPWGIKRSEVDAFLESAPELRDEILGERTLVRRASAESLAVDLAAIERHPVLDALHPGLVDRLRELASAPDSRRLYAVPYAVAWADETLAIQRHLFRAAELLTDDDPEFAGYLRNRGRDLLSNDYESGDASWVTGRFGRLNAQIGAYETYDDALFGVKAGHSMSVLVRDRSATEELMKTIGGLQAVENALPYAGGKRIREDIPVGVYAVVADFGQARGTNTATILPNDPLFSRRYGRTILLRANIMRHPDLNELSALRWRAAVAPAFVEHLAGDGGFQRTLWHEIGHYLGVDRTRDGRLLDQALQGWADAVEELKADLVSLFSVHRFHAAGTLDAARLRSVQASGILRTLQRNRPRIDQPYQTMQLAQFNYFVEKGLLSVDSGIRLEIDYDRYAATVKSLLAEVLELQAQGDPRAAEAFFTRWTAWSDDLHEPIARRMRDAGGPRYRLVLYDVLGD
jgi:hypothetical protein